MAFLSVAQESVAQDAARVVPLQADQLTAEQKQRTDTITAAPRNGKFNIHTVLIVIVRNWRRDWSR